jgi:hypothetical protein
MIGDGVLLVVEPDPDKWDTPKPWPATRPYSITSSREYFYDKNNPRPGLQRSGLDRVGLRGDDLAAT